MTKTKHRGLVAVSASDPVAAALRRLAGGDRAALCDVYDLTIGQVHRLALLRCGGAAAAAEHLVARTYQAVLLEAGQFAKAETSAMAWVVTQAHRLDLSDAG